MGNAEARARYLDKFEGCLLGGAIGDALHKADINIEDMRNPHNPATGHSMAMLSTNKPVAPELVASIAKTIRSFKSSALAF
jgi:hypothetical protein